MSLLDKNEIVKEGVCRENDSGYTYLGLSVMFLIVTLIVVLPALIIRKYFSKNQSTKKDRSSSNENHEVASNNSSKRGQRLSRSDPTGQYKSWTSGDSANNLTGNITGLKKSKTNK